MSSYHEPVSRGGRVIRQPLWWQARQSRALLLHLFAWSAWAQTNTELADTKGEGAPVASGSLFGLGLAATLVAGTLSKGAAQASVCSVVLGSASHCGGGN